MRKNNRPNLPNANREQPIDYYDSYTSCPVCGNKMGCSSANRTVRTLAMLYVYRRMCWYCRGPLEPMRKDNIYCSNNCRRRAHYYKKQRKGNNEIQE